MSISVVCFSKDRPLQLEACLRSLRQFAGVELPITVLYTCNREFIGAYEYLKHEYCSIRFLAEDNFQGQILQWLDSMDDSHIMFCCDDVFFKSPWAPDRILEFFLVEEQLIAFSLRLGKEISFCQPLGLPSQNPEFIDTDPFLVWNWRDAAGPDWRMPLELNCTIISREIVEIILSEMDRRNVDWGHPNRLEAEAAKMFDLIDGRNLMAAYPRAKAHCLAINRVQNECQFPVYHDDQFSPKQLLAAFESGVRLDVEPYRDRTFDRVHIGEVFFRQLPES